jgi:hypothetical protein
VKLRFWAAGVLSCATLAAVAMAGCYTAGGGSAPPSDQFYFPVGLAVSPGGHTLYAVNSDFDLQWSGGTLQSYNLDQGPPGPSSSGGSGPVSIRHDAQALIDFNVGNGPALPGSLFFDAPSVPCKQAQSRSAGERLGEDCAPPVKSSAYFVDSMVVGAFATDLRLASSVAGNRLFFPVRGTATLTWADVADDVGITCDPKADPKKCPGRSLSCSGGRCQVGDNANSMSNTRHVTMPGEPFGMAFTQDQSNIAITHQTSNSTSLFTSGFSQPPSGQPVRPPAVPTMQFVLNGVPIGGNGIAAVPHDPYAVKVCGTSGDTGCTEDAFLETNRTTPEVDLLRFYPDDMSSLQRPYLVRERVYPLTANSLGIDSRGIAIDPTPRFACDAKLGPNPSNADLETCGQTPARVFFASRSPPSLVIGEIGERSSSGSYDPDALVITGNVPLDSGPTKVYVAPIIDPQGFYEQRVFVVCFDSAEIFIYDPEDLAANGSHATPQGYIQTGAGSGPFAMAFDPMPPECVGIADPSSAAWNATRGAPDWAPWRSTACPTTRSAPNLGPYRFGYVGNFTQSFVQLIDLDASTPSAQYTFQQVVFTLGKPTLPKGQTPSKSTSIF